MIKPDQVAALSMVKLDLRDRLENIAAVNKLPARSMNHCSDIIYNLLCHLEPEFVLLERTDEGRKQCYEAAMEAVKACETYLNLLDRFPEYRAEEAKKL